MAAPAATDAATDSRWGFFPGPFYSPETSVGLAAILIYTYHPRGIPDTKTSFNQTTIAGTADLQAQLGNRGLFYVDNGNWLLNHTVSLRFWPDKFYGIGNNTNPNNYETYTSESLNGQMKALKRLLPDLYLGPAIEVRLIDLTNLTPGGMLASGNVPGSQNLGYGGIGGSLLYDTRVTTFSPDSGARYEVSLLGYPDLFQLGYSFLRTEWDFRRYFTLVPDHVLAMHLNFTTIVGTVPFTAYPVIGGGGQLRGIIEPLFRDQDAFYFVSEYRFQWTEHWGLAAFGGFGQVQPSLGAFAIDGWRLAGGAGVRYALIKEEKVNARLDFAFGPDGEFEFYFGAGDSF